MHNTCVDVMYLTGTGAASDKEKALKWFERAAAQTRDKDVQKEAKKMLSDLRGYV